MPGLRFDRLLTSTAVAILLSGVTIGAFAEPKSGSTSASAMAAPAAATAPSAPANDATEPAVKVPAPADQNTPAAAPAKPEAASDQPAGTPNKPQVDSAQPAAATATSEHPTAPAAAETSAAPPQPAAVTSGDEVPAAAAPAAPSAVADADAAVTEQLHELANGKFDRIAGGKKERAAIDAFYSGRNYAPLWIADGKPNDRATAAIAYLGIVAADGLDPADYPVPDFSSASDPAALADAELKLTTSIIAYAHHASVGRVHWTRVSGDIYYDQKPPAPAEVLTALAEAKDVDRKSTRLNSSHP
jgi:outer membrane biosynthesis protein TonB